MFKMDRSVRNSARNFKLPPIQGAVPAPGTFREPPTWRREAMQPAPKRTRNQRTPQASRNTFVVPNNTKRKDPGNIPLRAAYPNLKTKARSFIDTELPDWSKRTKTAYSQDIIQSYAVLPPIEAQIAKAERPAASPQKTKSSHVRDSTSNLDKSSEKQERHKKDTKEGSGKPRKRKEKRPPYEAVSERKTSATLLMFYEGKRKERRVAVCLENEPTLINIADKLKEIFLRRNMEEMYLI